MLCPLNISELMFCRNCVAYANEANIINKILLLPFEFKISHKKYLTLLPSFTLDRNTQYGLCYVAGLHVYFSVESCITIRITDVQNFRCTRYIARNTFVDGES